MARSLKINFKMTFYILSVNIMPDQSGVLINNIHNIKHSIRSRSILVLTTWQERETEISYVFILHHVRNLLFLKLWSTALFRHKQHKMYECQGMLMARQGTQKATQKAWTRSSSLVFLLLSKVSFTARKCFALVLNVEIVSPQIWPHRLPVQFWTDFRISLYFECFCSCFIKP